MKRESIRLSDCSTCLVIDDKDHYDIKIEPSENQIIIMGFNANKPASKFTHPNISATTKRIHEFKHYRKGGGKFWTRKAGVDHYLVIPRNQINIVLQKGYSYIEAEINGVKVFLSVSGGCGSNGWTDYLGAKCRTLINHKLADLKKISEVAIHKQLTDIKTLDEIDLRDWNELVANTRPDIKEAIAKLIEANKQPRIKLVQGLTIREGYGIGVRRRCKKTWKDTNSYKLSETGALKKVLGIFDGMRYSIKLNQINWHETAKENNLVLD